MSSREELVRIYLDKRPVAAAQALESLAPQASAAILADLPARIAGPVLSAMQYYYTARCTSHLSVDFVVKVVQQLSSSRAAALIRGLPVQRQDSVLSQLAVHHARTIRFLLSYAENLVGAWFDPTAITVMLDNSIGEIRQRLQQIEVKDIHRLFVVDHEHRLKGSVLISSLFQAKDEQKLNELVVLTSKTLRARTSLAVAEQHNDWQQYLEMPVIGRADELIGIITYKRLFRALQELRHGQPDTHTDDEQMLHGLTDLYRAGLHGAWQTWMELLSIPVDDRGVNSEHNSGRHRGA